MLSLVHPALLQLFRDRQAARTASEVALAVEAPPRPDPDPRGSWPVYLANLGARLLQCDVVLLAVASDAAVAAWVGKPLAPGHPRWVLVPLVLGPETAPVVHDGAVAELLPELAVLSAMVHGRGEDALAIAQAALAAVQGLEDERARLYADLVLASIDEVTSAILEALMASGTYEYESDFARRYLAQGKAEGEAMGRAAGEAMGRAQALLVVLAARGLDVPDAVRAHIVACVDLARLDGWLTRAVTATSAGEAVVE